jgi:copper chaperone CopZ
MKKIVCLCLMLYSFASFAKEINVKVSGMVCSMCAQGIQKKFSTIPEVKSLDVNLDKKIVYILTHDDKDVDDSTITKLITEAGYNVANIERK